MKTISIVCPCYNEEESLPFFFKAIDNIENHFFQNGEVKFQWIVVDDFSEDASKDLLESYCKERSNFIHVRNARNYGVYRSSYIGMQYSVGDYVVPMFPVDLQDPPSTLIELINIMLNSNYDGVFGRKIKREESFFMAKSRELFYFILSKIASSSVNRNVGEFGIVNRWVVDECLRRNDYYPYIRGMIGNITSNIKFHDYTWVQRQAGFSKHNFVKLYDQGMNAFVSSGAQFFRPITIMGFLLSAMSICFAILNIALYIFDRELFATQGIASIIVIISLGFGFLFFILGLLGEYLIALHSQVRGFDRFNIK